MPTLPAVILRGKAVYVDTRLGECRNTETAEPIAFSDLDSCEALAILASLETERDNAQERLNQMENKLDFGLVLSRKGLI